MSRVERLQQTLSTVFWCKSAEIIQGNLLHFSSFRLCCTFSQTMACFNVFFRTLKFFYVFNDADFSECSPEGRTGPYFKKVPHNGSGLD